MAQPYKGVQYRVSVYHYEKKGTQVAPSDINNPFYTAIQKRANYGRISNLNGILIEYGETRMYRKRGIYEIIIFPHSFPSHKNTTRRLFTSCVLALLEKRGITVQEL